MGGMNLCAVCGQILKYVEIMQSLIYFDYHWSTYLLFITIL